LKRFLPIVLTLLALFGSQTVALGQIDAYCVAANKPLPEHTTHSLNQKINRQVKRADELDAIRNPLKTTDVKIDSQGRPSQRLIGEKATVAINPETNKIVSVNPTSSKLAEKLNKLQE